MRCCRRHAGESTINSAVWRGTKKERNGEREENKGTLL